MRDVISGFDWDQGNRGKCLKHGVSIAEIEALFLRPLALRPADRQSGVEQRILAVGKGKRGRHIFLVFTLRERDGKTYVRPISARYMHKKEIESYEKDNPGL